MPWSPTILRKYSTTGHFRLLNQLRSELRENPMPRAQSGDAGGDGDVGSGRSPIRALEVRPRGGSGFRSRRPLQSAGNAAASNSPAAETENSGRTFRERLNAIDMR
jgi:hypothetical protein